MKNKKALQILAIVALMAIFSAGVAVAYFWAIGGESEPSYPEPEPEPCLDCDGGPNDPWDRYEIKKPVIYLYPEEEMEVEVKLGAPEKIAVDYPDYNGGWKVLAQPDGTLTMSGKQYYSLYYEADSEQLDLNCAGFVVAKDEVEGFLEEKLAILGLNYREREEFITYWAKDLEKSNYVFIRFMPKYEIDEEMPLTVSPAPDTTIRVMMQFKNLDERIEIDEQELTPVERTGFTVVEWGGVDLGKWY